MGKIKVFLSSKFSEFELLRRKIKDGLDNDFFEIILYEDRYPKEKPKFIEPRNAYLGLVEESSFAIFLFGSDYSSAVKEEFEFALYNRRHSLCYKSKQAKPDKQQQDFLESVKNTIHCAEFENEKILIDTLREELKKQTLNAFWEGMTSRDSLYLFDRKIDEVDILHTDGPTLRAVCINPREFTKLDIFIEKQSDRYNAIASSVLFPNIDTRFTGRGILFSSFSKPFLEIFDEGFFQIVFPVYLGENKPLVNPDEILRSIGSVHKLCKILFNDTVYEEIVVGYRLEGCKGAVLSRTGAVPKLEDNSCVRDNEWVQMNLFPHHESEESVVKSHMDRLLRYFNKV